MITNGVNVEVGKQLSVTEMMRLQAGKGGHLANGILIETAADRKAKRKMQKRKQ